MATVTIQTNIMWEKSSTNVKTHVVVELNSPVLLLGMFKNFSPGLEFVFGIWIYFPETVGQDDLTANMGS